MKNDDEQPPEIIIIYVHTHMRSYEGEEQKIASIYDGYYSRL